jgi:hypothetical protein
LVLLVLPVPLVKASRVIRVSAANRESVVFRASVVSVAKRESRASAASVALLVLLVCRAILVSLENGARKVKKANLERLEHLGLWVREGSPV